MAKYLFCFGTRPEAIKMAPVIHEAQQRGHGIEVCLTGQHHEMIAPFLDFFEIKGTYNLNVMKKNQSLSKLTAAILLEVEGVLSKGGIDCLFVQGDTTTTFACCLASFYHQIPVSHIEAGLRTGNIYSPFPEEGNRKLVSPLATFHFPPTENSRRNLEKEGIVKNVVPTGNTSIDTLRMTVEKIKALGLNKRLSEKFSNIDFTKKILLVTAHRRENHGEPLEEICKAIQEISKNENVEFVLPVHMNPNVKDCIHKYLSDIPNVHLLAPLDYLDFTWFMEKSFLILTDSGGVQEEAPYFQKPILVLRENTERPEGVEAGVSKLVGSDRSLIVKEVNRILEDKEYYRSFAKNKNPYGDGYASHKIIKFVDSCLN